MRDSDGFCLDCKRPNIAKATYDSPRLIREEAMMRDEPERSEILALADRLEEILNRE